MQCGQQALPVATLEAGAEPTHIRTNGVDSLLRPSGETGVIDDSRWRGSIAPLWLRTGCRLFFPTSHADVDFCILETERFLQH